MATLAEPEPVIAALRMTAWRQASSGDAAGAAATLEQALSIAPDSPDLLTAAADAHRFTGNLDEAIRLFDRALAIDPAQVAAWYGRGLAHMAVGATAAARDDFRPGYGARTRDRAGLRGAGRCAGRPWRCHWGPRGGTDGARARPGRCGDRHHAGALRPLAEAAGARRLAAAGTAREAGRG